MRMLRRVASTIAVIALLACAGCERQGTAGAASTSPSPTPTPVPASGAPCTARPNPAPGPVTDPNGPLFHQIVVAQTTDGLTLTDARIVQPSASVPDGVRAADGRTLVYYVNGAQHGIWVGDATGDGWAAISPISIDGVRDPLGVVDPDAYRVGDRIRLAYLANFTSQAERAICLAESDDGVSFRTLGMAVDLRAAETMTDPSVIQLPNGSWLMALSAGQSTVLARSGDGTTFTLGERLTFGGVPELAREADGTIRLYVCAGGIVAYRSADAAATWQREQTVVSRGPNGSMLACDPSRVAGTNTFVFKTGM
ncbi:MAG: sialidase family protein [Acidobacteriota bacterium]